MHCIQREYNWLHAIVDLRLFYIHIFLINPNIHQIFNLFICFSTYCHYFTQKITLKLIKYSTPSSDFLYTFSNLPRYIHNFKPYYLSFPAILQMLISTPSIFSQIITNSPKSSYFSYHSERYSRKTSKTSHFLISIYNQKKFIYSSPRFIDL